MLIYLYRTCYLQNRSPKPTIVCNHSNVFCEISANLILFFLHEYHFPLSLYFRKIRLTFHRNGAVKVGNAQGNLNLGGIKFLHFLLFLLWPCWVRNNCSLQNWPLLSKFNISSLIQMCCLKLFDYILIWTFVERTNN